MNDEMRTYLVVFASPVQKRYERDLLARMARQGAAGSRFPVIAVDAGYERCREAGVAPDCVVGDFDSLGYVPAGDDIRVFPCRKDATDGELAFEAAVENGAQRVVAFGAFGGRLDHELANVALFAHWAQRGVSVIAIGVEDEAHEQGASRAQGAEGCSPARTAACEQDFPSGAWPEHHAVHDAAERATFFISGPARLELPTIDSGTVSVLPLGGDARGITLAGLAYLLRDEDLPYGTTRGVSNEFMGEPVCVDVREGTVAVSVSAPCLLSSLFQL